METMVRAMYKELPADSPEVQKAGDMGVGTGEPGGTRNQRVQQILHEFESAKQLVAGYLRLVFEGEVWPGLKSVLAVAFGDSTQGKFLCIFSFIKQ